MNLKFCLAIFFVHLYTSLQAQPPNILFILADDMSYPFSSVYGDQVVKTPHLEKLAQHGVTPEHRLSYGPVKKLIHTRENA